MRKTYLVQSKRTKSLNVKIPPKITKALMLNTTGTKVEKFKSMRLHAVESFEALTQASPGEV
jgi:hypothetical protein